MRLSNLLSAVVLALLLAACSAGSSTDARTDAAQIAATSDHPPGDEMPISEPVAKPSAPPGTMPVPSSETETNAGDSAIEGKVDFSCTTDADCTVKDVGNCCGYYPACVNVDSPTFPDRVQAECQRQGMSSVCGFPTIDSCVCKAGRCEAGAAATLVE